MPCKRKTETKILCNAAQTKNLSNKLLSNPQDSTETQGKTLLEHMNKQKKKPVANIKNISALVQRMNAHTPSNKAHGFVNQKKKTTQQKSQPTKPSKSNLCSHEESTTDDTHGSQLSDFDEGKYKADSFSRSTNFQPYQFKTQPTHSHKTWFFTHKQRHKVSENMRQKGRKSRQQNSDFPTSKVTKTHALKDVYVLRKYWNLKEKNNLQYSCFLDEDPPLLVAWGLAISVALLALPP